jgi:transaldolase
MQRDEFGEVMGKIKELHGLGQSLWLDYISRELLQSGELAQLIRNDEIRGVTSNPTIFEKAVANSGIYTDSLQEAVSQGMTTEEILDDLILQDIRDTADLFLPLYDGTHRKDGFVSVEVNPDLAYDATGTLKEVRRLWQSIRRPNIMIKIPATEAGIPAIKAALSEGINVNITLIFSRERYSQVMEAYLSGLEERVERGQAVDHVSSVASFFVSRVDTAVDRALNEVQDRGRDADASDLLGKAAIANTKLAYGQFESVFSAPRFERLLAHGAQYQRPLWASTSTKNPAYPDTYYVDNLIGPNTVNTLPPKTLAAFKDHGQVAITISEGMEEAREDLTQIEALGVSLEKVTDQLEREGVEKFATSFYNLMNTIEGRVHALQQQS